MRVELNSKAYTSSSYHLAYQLSRYAAEFGPFFTIIPSPLQVDIHYLFFLNCALTEKTRADGFLTINRRFHKTIFTVDQKKWKALVVGTKPRLWSIESYLLQASFLTPLTCYTNSRWLAPGGFRDLATCPKLTF
jgi:hypothetical protein